MKKLTVLAAAFAAGVTTFAAKAEDISMHGEKVAALQATMRAESARQAEQDAVKTTKSVDKTKGASKSASAGKDKAKAAKAGKLAAAGKPKKTAGESKSAGKEKGSKPKRAEVAEAAAKAKAPAKAEVAKRKNAREEIDLTVGTKDDKLPGITITRTSSSGGSYSQIIARYASTYGVPVSLANAVIRVESNYRPNARGSAGEIGLMQIKPSTARMMGYSGSAKGLYNPETNIKFGMKYLGMAHQLGGGTTCGTILKYNAGHAARRMNPVSSAYCSKVKRHLAGV